MNGFFPLFLKEWLELVRTHRLTVTAVLFVLIGLGSPLTAALMPDILSALASDETGMMKLVLLKKPTVSDALFQFQKNAAILPLLIVLVGMGAVSSEKRRGTAALMLVKPASRLAFLLAKLVAPGTLFLAATALSALGCWLYTTVLFGDVPLGRFLPMVGLIALYFFFFQTLTLLGTTTLPGVAPTAGIGIAAYGLMTILQFLPKAARFTPAGLLNAAQSLALGKGQVSAGAPVAIAFALSIAFIAAAFVRFRRAEL